MGQLRQGKRRMEHRSLAPDLVVSDDNDAGRNQCAEELAPNVAQEELREEKQVGGPVNCSDSELSIYLQALAEGFLATYYSDTSQFVRSKSMSIASKSYQRGKKTVVFHGFPSFQMSRNSTGQDGKDWSIASQAGFRAKTSALPATARDLMENDPDSGWKWPGSLTKYDRDSRSWKTRQLSLLGGLDEFSETWPKWGSMRDGECFPLPMLDSPICEKESGLWPTPDASCGKRGWSANVARSLTEGVTKRKSGATIGSSLLWEPRLLPDYAPGYHLNPQWVEWLMGWPEGQTDLLPLAMDRFRSWQQQHGVF